MVSILSTWCEKFLFSLNLHSIQERSRIILKLRYSYNNKHNGNNEQYTQITPHKSHNGHCTPIYRHRTHVDGTSNQPIYFLCCLFVCINSMLFIPKAKPESWNEENFLRGSPHFNSFLSTPQSPNHSRFSQRPRGSTSLLPSPVARWRCPVSLHGRYKNNHKPRPRARK